MKIYNNTIVNTVTGIKVGGNSNAEILGNKIYKAQTGIEVDNNFDGIITNNAIQDSGQAILVNEKNPFEYFNIPSNISTTELYELFKKLDAHTIDDFSSITKESVLSKIDQFTSISERILNFLKVYGPILIATFGSKLM